MSFFSTENRVSDSKESSEMISWGDAPRLDKNRFPLLDFIQLFNTGLLVAYSLTSGIRFCDQDSYEINQIGVPAVQFNAFLEQGANITFQKNHEVLQVLKGNNAKHSVIGIVEEYWASGLYGKRRGTPNIIFYCDVGGNPSHRSARATYEDLYRLLVFLQNQQSS